MDITDKIEKLLERKQEGNRIIYYLMDCSNKIEQKIEGKEDQKKKSYFLLISECHR